MSQTETVVSGTPAAAAPPAAAVVAPADDVAALRARIAELERSDKEKDSRVAEHERNAQFWFEKAKGGKTDAPKPAPELEAEPDLLELITTKGAKGLTSYLKQQGLMTREEGESLVNGRAHQLVTEQQLRSDYPDLADEKSDFFKATALHYGELKKQGVPEATAMRLAARSAELDGIRAGKIKTPAQRTADEKTEREADRRARATAGGGDRGGRSPQQVEEDDTLSPDDQAAVRNLADALDIPLKEAEERYIKRAKAGVNVSLKLDKGGR
jgi:hypothetical protein